MHQFILAITLVGALGMFIWGRWRYDLVALGALLILLIAGVIEHDQAFIGFAHPAVITVAAVLVVSHGLRNSGAVDVVGARLKGIETATAQILALTAITAFCSAFMNNVGALAILMPVAVQLARSAGRPPSLLLMPIAFGSLFGGMMTLIGTPPNIIIAAYRADATGSPYRMFDFAPVGAAITIVGVLACGLGLWRLLPRREPAASRDLLFDIEQYTAELRIKEDSKAASASVRELGEAAEGDFLIIGIARGKRLIRMPTSYERLAAGDVLVVEADAETVKAVADSFGLTVEGDAELRQRLLSSGDSTEVEIVECIVQGGGMAAGRTPRQLNMRRLHGVNLLGIARHGQRVRTRLGETRLQPGDVLLLQGDRASIAAALPRLGCLPLAQRELRLGQPRRIVMATALMAAALLVVVFGLLPVEIAFTACACLMVLAKLVNLRDAYDSIDWPVIVLLAAMIPVGFAMESTGAAARVADLMLGVASNIPPWLAVGLHMATCMALSNVINNAAAAILMAPIAVGLARGLDASVDPFLMATAVGASAAFLTPIGHQSNTLVMGPGGYRFADYLRLGIPCSVLTLLVGVPAILWRWPIGVGGME